jgi:hypothetical protein
MTLQLARLVERVNRNFDERRLTGAVFLDVAKAFDTVWVKGFLYKLTVLNFHLTLLKPYPHTMTAVRSKRPSRQPRPQVVSCGLVKRRAESSPLFYSACM